MQALAIFSAVEPQGTRRREYELLPDVIRLRAIGRWETVETSIPLKTFTGEEIRRSFQLPFFPRTDLVVGSFTCGCLLLVFWLTIETSGQLMGVRERVLFGAFGFGLMLCSGLLVGLRYLRHDWRQWREFEFWYLREGEPTTVGILSDETLFTEQEQFLERLRSQIQRCRAQHKS